MFEKIELINTRFDPVNNVPKCSRVYDSLNEKPVTSTLKLGKTSTNLLSISFKSKCPSSSIKQGSISTLDFADMDKTGFHYLDDRKLKDSNFLRFSSSPRGLSDYFDSINEEAENIDLPTLNKIKEERSHCVMEDTIARRILEGKVPHCKWSQIERPSFTDTSFHLGPGDYDTESNFLLHDKNSLKFSTLPCNRSTDDELPPVDHTFFKKIRMSMRLEKQLLAQSVNNTREIKCDKNDAETHGLSLSPLKARSPERNPNESTALKFSEVDRFNNHFYRQEKYIRTSGFLSLDYDSALDKKIPLQLKSKKSKGDRLRNSADLTTATVDVDVDCGSKSTVATSIRTCPILYAAAFKSQQAEGGSYIPQAATSPHLGPGSFSAPPAIVVKDPDRLYPCFKIPMSFYREKKDVPNMDRLGETNPKQPIKGGKFLATDLNGKRNIHVRELAKKKIEKIYPRLAKMKYEERVPSLSEMIAAIPVD